MALKNSERRASYLKRKKQGVCPRCGGKKRKNDKFSYCSDCREFFRNYNEAASEKQNKKRKDVYDKRKKNHQCPRCGKKLGANYGKKICKVCLNKQYQYNYGKKR